MAITDPKDSGRAEVITATPQTIAEALVTQFFNELQNRVPSFRDVTSSRQLTAEQQTAVDLFKSVGAAMAVRDFATTPPDLPPRDDDGVLRVDWPARAVKARIYSQNRVREQNRDEDESGDRLAIGEPWDRVVRIEFFDCEGVVIVAVGSEKLRQDNFVRRTY